MQKLKAFFLVIGPVTSSHLGRHSHPHVLLSAESVSQCTRTWSVWSSSYLNRPVDRCWNRCLWRRTLLFREGHGMLMAPVPTSSWTFHITRLDVLEWWGRGTSYIFRTIGLSDQNAENRPLWHEGFCRITTSAWTIYRGYFMRRVK